MLGLTPLIFILRRAEQEQQQHYLRSQGALGEGLDKEDSLVTSLSQEFAEAAVEGTAVAAGAHQPLTTGGVYPISMFASFLRDLHGWAF